MTKTQRRWLIGLLASALAAVALVTAGVAWLLRGEAGSAWLLARVPGLEAGTTRGRLSGGPFAAERLVLQVGARTVTVEGLAWDDSRWAWRPHAGAPGQPAAWFGLVLTAPRAARLVVSDAPASGQPATAPTSLRLPLALTLQGARIGRLELAGQAPITDITGSAELGARGGALHRVEGLGFAWDKLRGQASGSIASDAPFGVELQADAASREGITPVWRAKGSARGPLSALVVQAQLGSEQTAAASLRVDATLQPFASWPIAALSAALQDLDLASLGSALPETRLSGRADIDTRGLDAPVSARIVLSNAVPGRWDQQRLPVASLEAELAGQPRDRSLLDVRRLVLQLANAAGAAGAAGRIEGSGQWRAESADLALTLQAVRPAALDARAPPMTLGGTASVQLTGLPSPDGSRPATARQSLQSQLALDGRLDARATLPVQVRATATAERDGAAWRADIRQAKLTGGGANAEASVSAARDQSGVWTVKSGGDASGIDPALWFPGAVGAASADAWRRGPHRLAGRWEADLSAAPDALQTPTTLPLTSRLLAWRGEASLDLRDSVLAGVPLRGSVRLGGRTPGWSVDADLQSGPNRAALRGRLAARAADDRWTLDLDASALAALQPLLSLQPALAAALRPTPENTAATSTQLSGQLSGKLEASGRWPEMNASANLRGSTLQAGRWRAARIEARAQAGTGLNAPLMVQLDGEQLLFDAQRIDTLQLRLDGSLAQHRLSIDLQSPLRPPTWAENLAVAARQGNRLQLRTQARWVPSDPRKALLPGQWRSDTLDLDVAPRRAAVATPSTGVAAPPASAAASAPAAAPAAPWLRARGLRMQVDLDAAGRVQRASAEPGRIEIGSAALRWTEANWRGASANAPASGGISAELEPLAVAPLLTLLQQPGRRIGGDLMLAGRARVSLGAAFAADIVLERASGDLTLTDDAGTQAFGLSDLRLALDANNGTWHFTQAVAGSNVGVLAGAVSLRLPPQATWPAPQTPMQGVLEWQVADLAAWAPFTPAGWRLGGMLRTSASVGGSFGAPEVTGQMTGSRLAIRNLLEGVDMRDGELLLSLRGDQATVERFVFKGGDGELRLTGGARLGATPSARLQATAERFRVLGRFDRRIVASGNATLALSAQAFELEGRVRIDEGLIDFSRGDAPTLDSDVQVRGGRAAAALATDAQARAVPLIESPPGADGAANGGVNGGARPRSVRMAMQVDLGDDLKLRGRGLDTRLRGSLALSSPGGRLAVSGTVRTEAGSYAAYGQNLEVERGVLVFAGAADNPRLDILAVRPNLDIRVGVAVTGFAQNPRIRLFSEPEMSDTDKLSWLVLGRAPEGLGRTDTALLQRAALALLAGEGGGLDNALLKNIGLDEFSVRQTDSGDVRDTVVTLGKQLSRRWYVGYERGVNSTTGTWQLIYRVAQRLTVRAQAGDDSALDAIWTWRW